MPEASGLPGAVGAAFSSSMMVGIGLPAEPARKKRLLPPEACGDKLEAYVTPQSPSGGRQGECDLVL